MILAGFAGVLAAGALVAGPTAMTMLYGDEFAAGRVDLALLCVGIGGFMAAGVFCQAALARTQAWQAASAWACGASCSSRSSWGSPARRSTASAWPSPWAPRWPGSYCCERSGGSANEQS